MTHDVIKKVVKNTSFVLTPTCLGLYVTNDPKDHSAASPLGYFSVKSYDPVTATVTLNPDYDTTYSNGQLTVYTPATVEGNALGRRLALEDVVDTEVLDADLTTIVDTGTLAGTKMIGWYPTTVVAVDAMRAVNDVVGHELDNARARGALLNNNAFLFWMDESRLAEWENSLEIDVPENATVEERRNVIVAKIRGQNKFNVSNIKSIVKTFTGGDAEVTVADGVISVKVLPPNNGQLYNQAALVWELKNKIPAHMQLNIERYYSTWGDVKNNETSWQSIRSGYTNWDALKDKIYK